MNYPPPPPPPPPSGGGPPGGYRPPSSGGYGPPPPQGYGPPPPQQAGYGYPQQPVFAQPGYGPPPYAGAPPGGGPLVNIHVGMGNPHAPYGVDPVTGIPFSDKSRVVAGLLQILLAGFGVGRFYTGHTGIAIAQILVTWFTCGIGGIWPFIDGIMMLTGKVTDAQGRPLRE